MASVSPSPTPFRSELYHPPENRLAEYHGDPSRQHDPVYRQRLLRDVVEQKEVRTCTNCYSCIMVVGAVIIAVLLLILLFDKQLIYDNYYLLGETPVAVHHVDTTSFFIIFAVLFVMFTTVVFITTIEGCTMAQSCDLEVLATYGVENFRALVAEKHNHALNRTYQRTSHWCFAFTVLSGSAVAMLTASIGFNQPALSVRAAKVVEGWDIELVTSRDARMRLLSEHPVLKSVNTPDTLMVTAPPDATLPWGALCVDTVGAESDDAPEREQICVAFPAEPEDAADVRHMIPAYVSGLTIIAMLPAFWYGCVLFLRLLWVTKPLYVLDRDLDALHRYYGHRYRRQGVRTQQQYRTLTRASSASANGEDNSDSDDVATRWARAGVGASVDISANVVELVPPRTHRPAPVAGSTDVDASSVETEAI